MPRSPRFPLRLMAMALLVAAGCAAAPGLYRVNPFALGDGGIAIRRIAVAPVIGPVDWLTSRVPFDVQDASGVAVSVSLGESLAAELGSFNGFDVVRAVDVATLAHGAPAWSTVDGAASLAQLLEADAIVVVRITAWEPANDLRLALDVTVVTAKRLPAREVSISALLPAASGMTRLVSEGYRDQTLYAASYSFEVRSPADTAALARYDAHHGHARDGSLGPYRDTPFPLWFRYCFFRVLDDVVAMESNRQASERVRGGGA